MAQSLRPHAHPAELNPCVHCERFDLCCTEINEYLTPTETTYDPTGWVLKHWCGRSVLLDTGGWADLQRYCHGHSGCSSDARLTAPTYSELVAKWNARNPALLLQAKSVSRSGWQSLLRWVFA